MDKPVEVLKAHYESKEQVLSMAMAEMEWPKSEYRLVVWYYNRLGLNGFLRAWQEQSYENEKRPPRSKYRAFRARLAKAMPSSSSRSEFEKG